MAGKKKAPLEIGARVAGVRAEDWTGDSSRKPPYVEPRETVVGTVTGVYPYAPDVVQVVSDQDPGDLVTVRDPELMAP